MKKKGFKLSLRIFAIFLALCAITLYLPNIMVSASASAPDDTVKAEIKSEPDALDETNSAIRELAESLVYTDVNTELETESGCMASETEYIFLEESESNTEMEIIGGMVEIQPPDETAAEIQVSPEVDVVIRDENGDYVLQGGVYAFENVGNEGLFMDIQQDKYLPGYHMQQYAANGNPAETFDRSCLFKITWRPETNSYIIRSMLNNRLSFYFSGNEVLTKEIEPRDADVPDSDTFKLIYNVEEGYFVIKPYNSSNVVAANDTTASGMAGAPNSYLKKSTEADSGDQARWYAYKYEGDTHSGVVLHRTVSTTNGIELGTTIEFALKTWTTVLGKNTPYMKVTPGYEDMVASSWDEDTYTFTITAMKAGELKLRPIIYHDGTTTAFRTYVSTFTIYPYLHTYLGFIKNSATGKYVEVEGPSTADGAFIQQNQFGDQTHAQWRFEIQSGGYFTIRSRYSNKYLGVDPTNIEYIKQYGTVGNNTLWKLIETASGNYKLVCKSLEASGYVLATQSRTSGNGSNLMMTPYVDDDNYRDEWNPQVYVVFENMIVDRGTASIVSPYALKDTVDDTPTTFTYTVVSGTDVVSVNNSTATIYAINSGTALIRVTNIAGANQYFRVYVPKRAIIIVPGIMGSVLVHGETEAVYWDEPMLNDINDGIIPAISVADKLASLRCNPDGSSVFNIVASSKHNYGAGEIYRDLHESLYNEYGHKYDICFFSYDWRMSNAISGLALDNYIQENAYDSVALVCHSMGGLVASSYLAIGQDKRDKIETLITLGTPYLGSPTMVAFWAEQDPSLLMVSQTDFMDGWSDWQKMLWNIVVDEFKTIDFIVGNFRSLYEMIPTRKYFDENYANRMYLVTSLMGMVPIHAETYNYSISELSLHLPYFSSDLAEDGDDFHNSLYINGNHVTSLVNTYYISGIISDGKELEESKDTVNTLKWNLSGWSVITRTEYGDMIVPAWSADLANEYSDKTFYVRGEYHSGLVENANVLDFINGLISQNASTVGYTDIEENCSY